MPARRAVPAGAPGSQAGATVRGPGGRLRGRGGAEVAIATLDEVREAPLDEAPLEQDVPAAGEAAQPDIGTQAIHSPVRPTAGMWSPEPKHVSQEQLERRLGWHWAGQGIRGAVCHDSA